VNPDSAAVKNAGAAVLFAQVTAGTELTNANFFIVGVY
jgi:hypothetical protein